MVTLSLSRDTRRWLRYEEADLCGTTSAAQKVRMSMAVRRVCRRDGTNTTAGLEGECFMMAWYTGLAMDSRRV